MRLSPWPVQELRRGLPRPRLPGRPVTAPSVRRGPRPATSPARNLLGSALSTRAAAAPGPPRPSTRAHLARLPPPEPRARREAVRRAGDAAIPAEGAAWGQRAPRARPPARRRRRRSLRARARGGGGAHVRVFVSGSRRTRGLPAAVGGHFLCHPGLGPELASVAPQSASLP